MILLSKAKHALEKSEAKAKELGINVSTVIVDEYGSIICASKMDGAIPVSPEFAYAKAYTAASLGMSTDDLGEYCLEGKPYFGLNTLFGGKMTPIAGGMPVKKEDKLIGGVGVGGSADVSQDAQCAQEAAKILSA